MVGSEAPGLLPNAAAKVGDGASSVSRALAKQDDEAPLRRVFNNFFVNRDC